MLRTVRTSTLCIGFEELGPTDGKPIVLVHGFPYSPHAYEAVAAPLATHGFRTIAPYLRGFGATCFRDANAMRTGEQAALGCDVLELITIDKNRAQIVASEPPVGKGPPLSRSIQVDDDIVFRARGFQLLETGTRLAFYTNPVRVTVRK